MMKLIKGDKGTNGSGSDKNGASAKDIIIKVPMGTVVTNASTGEVIADLVKEDEEKLLPLAEEAEEEIKPLLLMKTKPQ